MYRCSLDWTHEPIRVSAFSSKHQTVLAIAKLSPSRVVFTNNSSKLCSIASNAEMIAGCLKIAESESSFCGTSGMQAGSTVDVSAVTQKAHTTVNFPILATQNQCDDLGEVPNLLQRYQALFV